jgi:UDP-glucuronate decarboxylase
MSDVKYTLVAGGAGFLGSHLCKRLVDEGDNVLCIDNLSTGRVKNLENLEEANNFIFLKDNIIKSIKSELPIKRIFNLACPASPINYQKDPIFTLRTCFEGSLNLLNIAKDYEIPIFQASTSEIYGDPLEHPQRISYWGNVNPIGIRSCYDEGKRVAETLFFDFHRNFNVDIKVARIFNTYGPYMDINDGRVVSNFIVQALKNLPLTIYGDGDQTRSFCYVDDLIDAFLLMMADQSKPRQLYNVGNPEEYTVKDLAEKIIKLTNSKSELINLELPADDPVKRQPDITEIRSDLGWEPKIGLEEGLLRSIKYFQKLL